MQMSKRVVLYKDEECELVAEQLDTGAVMMHFEVDPSVWSKSAYKRWLDLWAESMEALGDAGIPEVYTFIDASDTKTCKFQEMFGLRPLFVFDSHIIFRSETWA